MLPHELWPSSCNRRVQSGSLSDIPWLSCCDAHSTQPGLPFAIALCMAFVTSEATVAQLLATWKSKEGAACTNLQTHLAVHSGGPAQALGTCACAADRGAQNHGTSRMWGLEFSTLPCVRPACHRANAAVKLPTAPRQGGAWGEGRPGQLHTTQSVPPLEVRVLDPGGVEITRGVRVVLVGPDAALVAAGLSGGFSRGWSRGWKGQQGQQSIQGDGVGCDADWSFRQASSLSFLSCSFSASHVFTSIQHSAYCILFLCQSLFR
jgi:hypothetical protein